MAPEAMLKTLLYTVNSLLQQQKYRAALAVAKGFRNGAVYGAKIRAPHALVMTFLFKSGSLREKFKAIAQINMYLLSRILFGLSRLAVEKGYIPEPKQDPFPLFAALVWGIVLWLFEYHRHTLQPSLQSSMTYLYDDSNVWHDVSDFLIYNKRPASK